MSSQSKEVTAVAPTVIEPAPAQDIDVVPSPPSAELVAMDDAFREFNSAYVRLDLNDESAVKRFREIVARFTETIPAAIARQPEEALYRIRQVSGALVRLDGEVVFGAGVYELAFDMNAKVVENIAPIANEAPLLAEDFLKDIPINFIISHEYPDAIEKALEKALADGDRRTAVLIAGWIKKGLDDLASGKRKSKEYDYIQARIQETGYGTENYDGSMGEDLVEGIEQLQRIGALLDRALELEQDSGELPSAETPVIESSLSDVGSGEERPRG